MRHGHGQSCGCSLLSILIHEAVRIISLYGHVATHIAVLWALQSRTEQCHNTLAMVQALKERLVERANIIQARHDSETAALVKRQVQHHFNLQLKLTWT